MTDQVETTAIVNHLGNRAMAVYRFLLQLAFVAPLACALFSSEMAQGAEATVAAKAIVTSPVAVSRVEAPAAAAEVDRLLYDEVLQKATLSPAKPVDDLTYLRRISLDIAGRLPTPAEITAFSLDPSTNKRSRTVERLLAEDAYAENWAHYSRNVIMYRRSDDRAVGDAAAR